MNNAQMHTITTTIDIVMRVAELLDEQNRRRVEHAMLRVTGVERAHFSDEQRHLLAVGYDPERITHGQILKLLRQHRLNAQLIGGI